MKMSKNGHMEPQTDAKPPFGVFLAVSVIVFFLTLSAADSIGFIPCQLDGSCTSAQVQEAVALADLPQSGAAEATSTSTRKTTGVLPTHIKIAAISLDLPVQNPSTTDLEVLDALLQNGPARHVESGALGDARNVVIFGHSSHLPIVHNKMFQAFNKVPDLVAGDSIEVDGKDGTAYLYSVDSVVKADTGSDTQNLITDDHKLIIVTCDTLTGKSARYIVTASYVGTVSSTK